jgi:hypothetical protein
MPAAWQAKIVGNVSVICQNAETDLTTLTAPDIVDPAFFHT